MMFNVPIYIEEQPGEISAGRLFVVRPVFLPDLETSAGTMVRALEKLRASIGHHIARLMHEPRHDALAACHFEGELFDSREKLRVELKSGSHVLPFLFIGMEALDRKVWHSPRLGSLWFETLPGQSLEPRAREVVTHYLREREREEDNFDLDRVRPPEGTVMRVSFLEIDASLSYGVKEPEAQKRMSIFGGQEKLNGAQELRRVGRRLDVSDSEVLSGCVLRDELADELAAKLGDAGRRSLLVAGPRLVGKSALIMEAVRRMLHAAPEKKERPRPEAWLISPMRLISGMSFVGQWENRLLAILEHSEQQDIVLCFDDLPGLLEAGKSASNDLSVANVLRPWLEQRRVRVLAEATTEVLRVLRERDRALADAFEIIPLEEPDEETSLRMMIHVGRELERLHHCEFSLDSLPMVMDLQRRFVRDAVFPGKGAIFLQRLATKHSGRTISRAQVLEEFSERSGLSAALLDADTKLARKTILKEMSAHLHGQDHVLHAFADVLLRLKARMSDPARPLAAMLLLGPTGVGKTEAAKTLARHLFGDEARLLRFDMNEMTDASAVPRLTGSPREPDGLLTNAIRRQPFAVVLFDEIEKAAPEVFDMLLAVLDEGRLTDALGRVADFTNAVVLLTSNLGAREARTRLGFVPGQSASEDHAFVSAAEKFFRPEFFNRLDALLPFHDLNQRVLRSIAESMIQKLLQRDGVRQRSCFIEVTAAATERLAALGHHPQLGARALKRALEQQLAEPLALELAAMPAVRPVHIRFDADAAAGGLRATAKGVVLARRDILWPERLSRDDKLARAVAAHVFESLDRLEALIDEFAPSGVVELTALTREQARYFQWREQWKRVRSMAEAADRALQPQRRVASRAVQRVNAPQAVARRLVLHTYRHVTARHDQRLEAEQLQSEIGEPQARQTDEIADTPMVELVRELALLETIITTPDSTAECVLRFTSGKGAIEGMPQLAHALTTVLQSIFGDDAATRSADHHTVTIRDAAARVLAEQFAAAIWCDSHWAPDSLSFGHIESAHEPPEEAADQITVRYRLHDDLGVFLQDIILVDLRTGLEFNSEHGSQGLRPLLLTALPLPVELADMLGVPSDAVLPETVNPARPVTARASVSMDDDIPF